MPPKPKKRSAPKKTGRKKATSKATPKRKGKETTSPSEEVVKFGTTLPELRKRAKQLGVESAKKDAQTLLDDILDEIIKQYKSKKINDGDEHFTFYAQFINEDPKKKPAPGKKGVAAAKKTAAQKRAERKKAAPGKKKGTRKPKGEPSTKFLVHQAWAKSKKKLTAEELYKKFPAVKLVTIKGWIGGWKKGKYFPAGVTG
jgi:hypothetical protein